MLPSASRLDRAFACLGSAVLPPVEEPQSEAAARGQALHLYLEIALRDGRDAALAMVAADEQLHEQARAIDLSTIPAGAESEVAFGFDVQTGRGVRYESKDRRYPFDGFLHGTADLVGATDRAVWLADYKTGRPNYAASDSWQLRFLALAAARWSGLPRARVALLVLDDSGCWREDRAEFDEFDLAGFQEELRRLVGRVKRATPETVRLATGSHCKHCPALLRCPAQTAIVRALVPSLTDITGRLDALSPEDQGRAYTNLKLAEELIERAKDAFRVLAANGDIQLPDGRVLRQVVMNRSTAARGASEYVAKVAGVDVLAAASTLKLSSLPPEVLADLEHAGLVDRVPVTQVRPVGKRRAA